MNSDYLDFLFLTLQRKKFHTCNPSFCTTQSHPFHQNRGHKWYPILRLGIKTQSPDGDGPFLDIPTLQLVIYKIKYH